MLMEVHCPSCGMRLRIDQRFAGRKGRCPNCRNKMMIPALDAPGVLLLPEETPEAARRQAAAQRTTARPAEGEVFLGEQPEREPEGLTYVLPPKRREDHTPPTIQLLFREKVRLLIEASPRWLLSLVIHLAFFGVLSLVLIITPPAPVPRVLVQGRVIEAEAPKMMANLEVKEEERPKMEDILTSPTSTPVSTKPMLGDITAAPDLAPGPATNAPDSAPAVIGIDAAGIGSFTTSGGGGGRGFTAGSLGVGKSSVKFFGNEAKRGAESIVFIVDASHTMDKIGRAFERALAELRSSIEKLTAGHRFNIIFFSEQSLNWQEHMVVASPENKRLALEFAESMKEFKGFGGTLPVPPMKAAMADNPEVIFFLTDGGFLSDDSTELLAMNKDKKVRIYTIGFGDKVNEPLLQKLADQNNGRYILARM